LTPDIARLLVMTSQTQRQPLKCLAFMPH
jgi:hypothetical protein